MLWKKGRRSDNVEDVRDQSTGGGGGGMRFGGGKGLSLMAVVVIVGFGLLTGQDPMQILGQLSGQMTEQSAPQVTQQAGHAPPANDEQADFVRAVLGDTEDTWLRFFSSLAETIKTRPWCCLAGKSVRPAVMPRQPVARSIARQIRRCTWT